MAKDETEPTVNVGTSTVAGLTTAATGFVMAVLALLAGDHTQATIGAIVGGLITIGALAPTIISRALQQVEKIRAQAYSSNVHPESIDEALGEIAAVGRRVMTLESAVSNLASPKTADAQPSSGGVWMSGAPAIKVSPPDPVPEVPDDLLGEPEDHGDNPSAPDIVAAAPAQVPVDEQRDIHEIDATIANVEATAQAGPKA